MASDGGDRAPESPSSSATNSTRIAARSSLVDSIRGCGLSGMRIDKDDLKRRLLIPEYLRLAMIEAIRRKEPNVRPSVPPGSPEAPDAPMIIFINSRSGGRHGPILKDRLEQLMGEEQVFDILTVKPTDFVQYGLACLESIADCGDNCARETREKLRVMVAGGDGTVGWVLSSLAELYREKREPVPPLGIIPLGTGNDLARSFGWGGSFPFAWRSAVKRSLFKAVSGSICRLDSWHVVVSMPSKEDIELPHSLKRKENSSLHQDGDIEGHFPDKSTCFEGVFYNYFSIGMDAQVAYGFHHLRDEKPNLANGPIANKLIYSGYSCTQGWFFTPCTSDPGLRGLNNILRLHIKKVNCSEWEQIQVPSRIHSCDPNEKDTLWPEVCVRALVALNLHNYGSGRHPWGNLKPDYLEKRGFVEAHSDDGLLEIFGLKHGWHASFVMIELISAKHIAQAAGIRVEIRGDQWKDAFMQMDGEPWKQPIKNQHSTVVEIKRVPFRSLMINGE